MNKINSLFFKKFIIFDKYFSINKYIIYFIDNNKLFYRLIYNLKLLKLILKTYLKI